MPDLDKDAYVKAVAEAMGEPEWKVARNLGYMLAAEEEQLLENEPLRRRLEHELVRAR